jgi:uncharacterized membrane protein
MVNAIWERPVGDARAMGGKRNRAIDVVRGLAIFIMLPANLSAYVYAEPHPLWFRIFSSFAAPVFICIAGMMVVLGGARRSWSQVLTRAGLLLTVGALQDMLVWNIWPFHSFDVLYLIGISAPLTYIFARCDRFWQLALIALIIVSAPTLQLIFGYTDYPTEYLLRGPQAGKPYAIAQRPTSILQHLFIDGWFPLLPWLSVSFSGAFLSREFFPGDRQNQDRRIGMTALALLIIGMIVWWLYPGEHQVRVGYSEMFYPAVPGFVLTGIGFTLAALWLAHHALTKTPLTPLRLLGESSLACYVFHYPLIKFGLAPLFSSLQLPAFVLVDCVALAVLLIFAWGLRQLKRLWPERPFLLRFLMGG